MSMCGFQTDKGKVTIHGLGSLGSQGFWAPWAPYGAGLLGLWAPEGDVPSVLSMVLGSRGYWAPELIGLLRTTVL